MRGALGPCSSAVTAVPPGVVQVLQTRAHDEGASPQQLASVRSAA